DFPDLHAARRLRQSASGAAARPRRMIPSQAVRHQRRDNLRRIGIRGIVAAAFLAVTLSVTGCSSLAADPVVGPADLALVQEAIRQVEKSYVVPVTPDKLVGGALKGMLNKLDPHSDYMSEREY